MGARPQMTRPLARPGSSATPGIGLLEAPVLITWATSLDAEPVALRVGHLDPVLALVVDDPAFRGAEAFEPGDGLINEATLLLERQATPARVDVEMDRAARVGLVALDEDARADAGRVHGRVDLVAGVGRQVVRLEELAPGFERLGRRLGGIADRGLPERGDPAGVLRGEDDLDSSHGRIMTAVRANRRQDRSEIRHVTIPSVSGDLRLLATGRTAEVFELDDGRVLKLLRPGFPDAAADNEAAIAHRVRAVYASAPRCDGVVRVDGRVGVVYERIDGPTMDAAARARPWRVVRLGRELGRLHAEMHRSDGSGFRDQRTALHEAIDRAAGGLSPAQAVAAHARTDELTAGTRLCHADLHPGNVILGRTPTVIDWENVRSGSPAADVARSIFLIRDAAMLERLPGPIAAIAGTVRGVFLRSYLAGYRSVQRLDPAEIDAWRLPILAARLAEGIVEERTILLDEIERAVGGGSAFGR